MFHEDGSYTRLVGSKLVFPTPHSLSPTTSVTIKLIKLKFCLVLKLLMGEESW